jgi:methylisocitrate lyase
MQADAARALRRRLEQPEILVVPGAVDALNARLIEQAGFDAVYATGAGISNSLLGLPDLGLATMTEIVEQARRMTGAISIPLIADADTGYGNPLNVVRTVREMERAGVAGIQIEDQVSPKKCGHFSGKEVVAAGEMVQKIRAAAHARQNPDTLIVARTDAIATAGLDEAIRRGRSYAEAGADVVFVEAPRSLEEIVRIPKEIDAPLLFNMTEGALTPMISAGELQDMGYRAVIFPNAALRVAMLAVRTMLAELHAAGTTAAAFDRMETWANRQQAVGLPEYEQLEQRFVESPVENGSSDG